ncbi:MAG: hypothetical protein IID39_02405 [Planctomycetes bacterium]|nr:hypothetical protein [Planctomycetota bacterium]
MGKNLDWFTCTALGVGVLLFLGCRDEPAPERFNVNLGTPDKPLLPVSVRQLDPSVLEGRADIVPLPTIESFDEQESADEGFGTDADRAAIAAVIEQVQNALAHWDAEALLPRVVASQREVLHDALPEFKRLVEAVDALKAAVVEADPALEGSLDVPSELAFNIPFDDPADIQFASDVEAFLGAGQLGTLRFEKTDEGWQIAFSDLQINPAEIGQVADAIQQMTENVKAGTLAPVQAWAMMQSAAGASDEGGQ